MTSGSAKRSAITQARTVSCQQCWYNTPGMFICGEVQYNSVSAELRRMSRPSNVCMLSQTRQLLRYITQRRRHSAAHVSAIESFLIVVGIFVAGAYDPSWDIPDE